MAGKKQNAAQPLSKTNVMSGEKVTRRLFRDGGRYRDDVPILVNGQCIQVQRGVDVTLPPAFAEVLDASVAQDRAAQELIDRKASEFREDARRYLG